MLIKWMLIDHNFSLEEPHLIGSELYATTLCIRPCIGFLTSLSEVATHNGPLLHREYLNTASLQGKGEQSRFSKNGWVQIGCSIGRILYFHLLCVKHLIDAKDTKTRWRLYFRTIYLFSDCHICLDPCF